MPYDVLTIDTNVAYGNGFDFEGGLLAQISQFAAAETRFALSDIVVQEIYKRLVAMAQSTRDKFEAVGADALVRRVLSSNDAAAFQELVGKLVEPRDAARERLEAFLQATGAEIVSVQHADINRLSKLYFSADPPFEATGQKKAEFPDAIALLSLEAWAGNSGKRVLAVSKDAGWKAFSEKSERIDVVEDLAKGLQLLQEHADQAATAVDAVLRRAQASELPDLAESLDRRVAEAVSELYLDAEGTSWHEFEGEVTGVAMSSYGLLEDPAGQLDVTIVRVSSDEVVARVGVRVQAIVEGSFSLQHWDGIDREYVSLGTSHAQTDIEFEAGALITLCGALSRPEELEIERLELIDAIDSVDFGEIEMDRGEDYFE